MSTNRKDNQSISYQEKLEQWVQWFKVHSPISNTNKKINSEQFIDDIARKPKSDLKPKSPEEISFLKEKIQEVSQHPFMVKELLSEFEPRNEEDWKFKNEELLKCSEKLLKFDNYTDIDYPLQPKFIKSYDEFKNEITEKLNYNEGKTAFRQDQLQAIKDDLNDIDQYQNELLKSNRTIIIRKKYENLLFSELVEKIKNKIKAGRPLTEGESIFQTYPTLKPAIEFSTKSDKIAWTQSELQPNIKPQPKVSTTEASILIVANSFAQIIVDLEKGSFISNEGKDKNKKIAKGATETFKWKGNPKKELPELYEKMIQGELISKETEFDQFESIFMGMVETKTFKPLEWTDEPVLLAYFIDTLVTKGKITKKRRWVITSFCFKDINSSTIRNHSRNYKNNNNPNHQGKPKDYLKIDSLFNKEL
ncbi:hypothetical protein [Membranihabitans maritimus]|uniref:hypothetical protein n=1 Tax=Membranihabitans maritimus TaxID=2904244 RepID=UPI001F44C706|nr:hypothetical protein [Membranihabitans maritimus]